MPRLEGKVALISGGARGQGAVEARMFAGEGAKVIVGDILDAEGQQVEAEINEGGGECVYVRGLYTELPKAIIAVDPTQSNLRRATASRRYLLPLPPSAARYPGSVGCASLQIP